MSSVPTPFDSEINPFPLTFIDVPTPSNWRLRAKHFVSSYLNHPPPFNTLTSTPDDTSNNYYQLTLSDSRVSHSNCAQIFIELRDTAYDEFQLSPYKDGDSYPIDEIFDPINGLVINTDPKSKCRKRNVIEVIIRSRLINNLNIFIKDTILPKAHRNLQRRLSFASSCVRDQNLSAQIHNYLDILRAILTWGKRTPPRVISFMNVLVEKSLTIDKSFDVPITIINRLHNCKIYYLKYFYVNYIILIINNIMQFLDNTRKLVSCAICLEDDIVGIMLKPCNHYNICNNCLDSLLNGLCPICRTPVVSTTTFIY